MPAKLHRCVQSVLEKNPDYSEDRAYEICNAQMNDSYRGVFSDGVVFDPVEKTAISVRDGVIEYLGMELGIEPPDTIIRVYRSPATIANVHPKMNGIAITDGHVPLDVSPPGDGGSVNDSEMIDSHDPSTITTIAIRNRLAIGDTLAPAIEAGKRELSLGYHADLVPYEGELDCDFEQRNIQPHHLAAVDRGRCGSMCSFIDKLPDQEVKPMSVKLHKAFVDKDGVMNLQQIVELATALPEAIKSVPVDQLQELLPALQQIVEVAKGVIPESEPEPEPTPAPTETETGDEEMDKEKDKPESFSDADMKKFAGEQVKRHTAVIDKARAILPDDYAYADKSTEQIMRDTLKECQPSEKFADAELDLAFKLARAPVATYKDFGDKAPEGLSTIANEEL